MQVDISQMYQDMYHCSGFQGQMVAIIPSLDLIEWD
jgi:hypothetical protein